MSSASFPIIAACLLSFGGMVTVCFGRPEMKFHLQIDNKTASRIVYNSSRAQRGFFDSEDNIVFPDTYQLVFEPLPPIEGPPACAGDQSYCEEFAEYPGRQIEDILRRRQVHRDLFGQDGPPVDFTNRLGDIEDIYVCSAVERTIFPKVARNKNNKWKYVINGEAKEGYVQGVRVEVCRRAGQPCDVIGGLPSGYTTTCKQKYIYRRLMSLSNTGEPVPDLFSLPSACCCAYRRDVGFLRSLGALTRTSPKPLP